MWIESDTCCQQLATVAACFGPSPGNGLINSQHLKGAAAGAVKHLMAV